MSGSFKNPDRVSVAVLTSVRWSACAKAAEDSDMATTASRSAAQIVRSVARVMIFLPGFTRPAVTRVGTLRGPVNLGHWCGPLCRIASYGAAAPDYSEKSGRPIDRVGGDNDERHI